MPRKLNLLFLSLFSALLMSISWYWHLSVFIFFALVPLLLLEHKISTSSLLQPSKPFLKLFAYAYLTFFVWNILVTWWVVYASFGGACIAFVFNSLFMALVFVFYAFVKKQIHKPWAVWLLIPIWIAWEHWHTIWDLSWSWLNLGNVFAFNHNWVQWFEYTGASGGTVWILASNILVFQTIKNNTSLQLVSKPILKIAALIIVPIFFSTIIIFVKKDAYNKINPINTLVVQPNIDPYNIKFVMDYQSQFFKVLNIIRGRVSDETDYLVLPETFITDNLNEENLKQYEAITWFKDSLLNKFPNLKIVCGSNTYLFYQNEKDVTATARKDDQSGKSYDVFNTAMQIDTTNIQVYHKSILVPGVERMPFPALLKPLEGLAIDMGGTMGSLGTQGERAVFSSPDEKVKIAPVVCYESIYADYVTQYIRKGANLIFIITNDGWWENTPGYIQHLNYARLRAIENRRDVARSANTGISCFIDKFGNISNATSWWEEAAIEKNMYVNNELTFFSRFGDLISYASLTLTILLIFWMIFIRFKR